jgi:hypothetical protein
MKSLASDKVYQLLAQGRWFSPGTPTSSTTKTGRHDIAEILLKVALNTKKKRDMLLGLLHNNLEHIRKHPRRITHFRSYDVTSGRVTFGELLLFLKKHNISICNMLRIKQVLFQLNSRGYRGRDLKVVGCAFTCCAEKS